MSRDRQSEEWLRELESFLKTEEVAPPQALSRAVKARVFTELNPSIKLVAAKLFALQAVGAALVTLVCPQLGVGPFIGDGALFHAFMHLGPLACAAACGGLFLGVSAALATVVLAREELRLANRHGFLNATGLAALSFAGLMVAGGEADRWSYAFWIAGAVLTGWLTLKLGATARLRPHGHGGALR